MQQPQEPEKEGRGSEVGTPAGQLSLQRNTLGRNPGVAGGSLLMGC